MEQKRIAIVYDGMKRALDPIAFWTFCESLRGFFETAKMPGNNGMADSPVAVVSRVGSSQEAMDLATAEKIDMVIFTSEEMHRDACILQRLCPNLEILVFTDEPLRNHPFLIPRQLATAEGIKQMLLRLLS
jgi:hypothetical protein